MAEPRVRFKRDDGSSYPDWNEELLGSLVSDNLDPVPTPKEGYRRVGIYCHAKGTFQEDVPAENILDVDTMYRIHEDNLIVNITFAWEHAVAIVKPEDEGLLVSHRFPEYSFNEGQFPGFYKYLVLRPYFKHQLSLASPGGAGRNRVLNKAQFKKIPIYIPCEDEQKKIADFLSSVDEVITTSEEEVTNLETQKKAVMKKIFSQEVRFKKADGSDFPEWEEVKVLDMLVQPITDGPHETPELVEDGVPFVSVEAIENGRVNLNRRRGNITKEYDNLCAKKYKPQLYDVYMVKSGATTGKLGIVTIEDDFNIWSPLAAMRTASKTEAFFLFFMLQSDLLQKQVWTKLSLGNQPNLGMRALEGFDAVRPCIDEQRLIADFLSDFDEAIAAAKKELELWKELKKGLLQQMFV